MLHRRQASTYIALALATSLNGCATPSLETKFTYLEKIRNLYGLKDSTKLTVVGERYHYLLEDKGHLMSAVQASFGKSLTGKFSRFNLYPDDTISGYYNIRINGSLTMNQINEATQLGFHQTDGEIFEMSARLVGMRSTTSPLVSEIHLSQGLPSSIAVEINVLGGKSSNRTTSSPFKDLANAAAGVVMIPVAIGLLYIFWSP